MNPVGAPVLSEAAAAVCFCAILLSPFALAGIAILNAGLGRSKNVAHSLLGALCLAAVASIVYFAVGFAWMGYAGEAWRGGLVNGKTWSWIGAGPFLLRGIVFDASPLSLAVTYGLFAAGLTAIIPSGAAGERWSLGASCASTVALAGVTFPLFAHWSWGGGWLEQLGANYGVGRGLIDSGGAGVIHGLGGLTALSMAWILGPRRGKYQAGGMPAALPAHNVPFVLLGCFLAWVGIQGLDCAGAILFTGVDPARTTVIPLNATLAAAAAVLAAAAITRGRFGKTDASLSANAWVGGLVASSAGCAVMHPAGAVLTGLVGGALVAFSVGWLEFHARLDDPGGAISVHGIAGLWGLLAAALFAQSGGPGGEPDQWMAQLLGIATLIGFVLPVAYGLNRLLDRFVKQRVAPEGERQGLDLYELGAGAYPDFMTHSDDY